MPTGIQETIEGLTCSICTEIIIEHSEHSNILCSRCDDAYLRSCDTCGDSHYNRTELGWMSIIALRSADLSSVFFYFTEDGYNVCEDCVWWCPDCNSAYSDESDMLNCCSNRNNSVHFYGYKPGPMFHDIDYNRVLTVKGVATPGVLYMGIELEVAKMADLADEFHERMSFDEREFLYMKEDGSLGADGVELVTHPATMDGFKKMFPFESLDWARREGARSFAYHSCGFHIHVSRSAFSPTHMWKFVKFQMHQYELCQKVAQREDSSYATWHWEQSEHNDLPEYIKGKKSNGRRYLAINFQNRNTVELRYFKGNMLRGAIMKNLEFVQSVYDYTKGLTVRDVAFGALNNLDHYYEWLDSNEGYENLKYFLINDRNKESE